MLIVVIWIGLTLRVGSWVMLLPIGLACAGAVGLGLHTMIFGRHLPFFPRSRREHGMLAVLAAVIVWTVAYQVVPQTFEEKKRQEYEAWKEAEHQALLHAQVACKLHIRSRLNAPSTAQFSVFPAVVRNDDGSYVVKGEVDAQNAFGVLLHRTYICSVGPSGTVLQGSLVE